MPAEHSVRLLAKQNLQNLNVNFSPIIFNNRAASANSTWTSMKTKKNCLVTSGGYTRVSYISTRVKSHINMSVIRKCLGIYWILG